MEFNHLGTAPAVRCDYKCRQDVWTNARERVVEFERGAGCSGKARLANQAVPCEAGAGPQLIRRGHVPHFSAGNTTRTHARPERGHGCPTPSTTLAGPVHWHRAPGP